MGIQIIYNTDPLPPEEEASGEPRSAVGYLNFSHGVRE